MAGTNVEVVEADATALPFPDGRFSAALSFTMLHHVPTPEQQDQLFAQVARVLQPGGTFAGVDSKDSPEFRDLHIDDICVPLVPDESGGSPEARRLLRSDVHVNPYVIQFRAKVLTSAAIARHGATVMQSACEQHLAPPWRGSSRIGRSPATLSDDTDVSRPVPSSASRL